MRLNQADVDVCIHLNSYYGVWKIPENLPKKAALLFMIIFIIPSQNFVVYLELSNSNFNTNLKDPDLLLS